MALTKVKASNITLTTAAASSNDTTPATTQYVTTALANMVDSAPSTLNTLNELAAALGDDANFSTTVTNSIATKAPLASPTFTTTITTPDINITGGSQIGQDYAYLKSNSTSTASLTLRKDSTGADSIDFLQLRSDGNGLIGKIEGDGDISFKNATLTGNLGIGVSVSSAIGAYVSRSLANGLAAELSNTESSSGSGLVVKGGNNASTYSADFRDYNGTSLMRITGAGNVGIGQGAPSYKLEVNGTAHVVNTLTAGAIGIPSQGISLNQGFGTGVPTMTMTGTAANARAGAILFQEQGSTNTAAIYSTDGGAGNAGYGGLTIATYQSDLRFATNGLASTRMIITSGGDVGIGTSTPFGQTSNRRCFSVNGTSSVSLNIGVGNAQKGYLFTDGNMTQLGSVGSIPLKFAPNDSPKLELSPSGELSMYGNKMVIDSDYNHWSGKYQHLTCHNAITSSNTWTDVAYVSYSPSLTIQGMAQRDNNGGYGASNFLGSVFGGYGATAVAIERSVANPMNGGGFGALEYRYLNSGASSGSYRLQVKISIGAGTMYITTTLTGQAFNEITED